MADRRDVKSESCEVRVGNLCLRRLKRTLFESDGEPPADGYRILVALVAMLEAAREANLGTGDLVCDVVKGRRCRHSATLHYDSVSGAFRVGKNKLHVFVKPGNQRLIVDAFEKQGWPERIFKPLGDHRHAHYAPQMKEAIFRLNRCLKPKDIRFHFRAADLSVSWEYAL